MSTCIHMIIISLSFVTYIGLTKNIRLDFYWMLKRLTWILPDVRDDVRACDVTVLYHIHYIYQTYVVIYYWWIWHISILTLCHMLSLVYVRMRSFTFCILSLCVYAGFDSFFFLSDLDHISNSKELISNDILNNEKRGKHESKRNPPNQENKIFMKEEEEKCYLSTLKINTSNHQI